jgi:hypothetical protein
MVHGIIFVAVAVLLGLLMSARRADARAGAGVHVLEYPGVWRWFSLGLAVLIPLALFALVAFHPPRTPADAWAFTGLVAFFALLGGWLSVETWRRVYLRPDGLVARSAVGREQHYAWEELSQVRPRPSMQQLELRFGQRRVRLSRYLSGLESLAEALRRHAPRAVANPHTLHAVLAHAGGRPSYQLHLVRRPTPRNWEDRLRDATSMGYEEITDAFEPAFTRWVATWPVLCVLPLGSGATLELLLASLLRRDLGLAGALSVLGGEETGRLTFEALLAGQREPDSGPLPWKHVAAVGCTIEDSEVVLHGRLWTMDALQPPLQLRIRGRAEEVGALTAELAERFAEALGLAPPPEVKARWRQARPRSLAALAATAHACEAGDLAWLASALASGEAHPNAITLVDADETGPQGQALLGRAALTDPADAQLCFLYFATLWKGRGRDSAAARVLVAGLQAAPGHGKSQMCLAHLFEKTARNAERILAHAEASERLLPGNPFAAGNLLGYLNLFAPDDARRGALVERMLAQRPDHPDTLCNAMDYFIHCGEAQRALQLARHFEALCTEPVSPEVLYALRQNPAMAAAMDRGELTPLDEARRCVAICEAAVRAQSH